MERHGERGVHANAQNTGKNTLRETRQAPPQAPAQ